MKKTETDALAAQIELAKAKMRFLKAADAIAPLNPVRKHPLLGVGIAFLAGFGFSAIGRTSILPAFISAEQLTNLAVQVVPLLISRARSSGG